MSTKYTCTALAGTNKVGKLSPDANGYYKVVLGAFDFYNESGAYWPYQQARHLFEGSSSFMRRLNNGQCRGELGHPRQEPGMSYQDYVSRILQIHEDKVTHHIKKCWIDNEAMTDSQKRPIIAVMGEIKPSGPYGNVLKDSLQNPDENVAFSVRSLCEHATRNGRMEKHMKTLVTYDYVNEPGIRIATKYASPSLETLTEDILIVPEVLESLNEKPELVSGLESSGVTVELIKTELGWSKIEIAPLPSLFW